MKKECTVETKNIDSQIIIHRVVFTFILIACCSIPISSARETKTHEWRFSLDMQHVAMIKVFDEIEKKSDFVFAWSCDVDTDIHRDISIHVSEASITSIMDLLLENTNLTYRKLEKQIVIYRCKSLSESMRAEAVDTVQPVIVVPNR